MAKSKEKAKPKAKAKKKAKPLETVDVVIEALTEPVADRPDAVTEAQDLLNTAQISMGAGAQQVRYVTEAQFNRINSLLSQARGS